jgi:hypothetical protein
VPEPAFASQTEQAWIASAAACSALMLASRITLANFSVSSMISLQNRRLTQTAQ